MNGKLLQNPTPVSPVESPSGSTIPRTPRLLSSGLTALLHLLLGTQDRCPLGPQDTAAVTRVDTEGGGGQVLLAVSLVVGSLSSMQSRGTGCHWLQGHEVMLCPFLSPDHQKLEREARICRLLKHSNIGTPEEPRTQPLTTPGSSRVARGEGGPAFSEAPRELTMASAAGPGGPQGGSGSSELVVGAAASVAVAPPGHWLLCSWPSLGTPLRGAERVPLGSRAGAVKAPLSEAESPRQRIFTDTYPVPAGDSAEGKATSTLTSLVGCSRLKRLLLSTTPSVFQGEAEGPASRTWEPEPLSPARGARPEGSVASARRKAQQHPRLMDP
ncbi:hypothetical protein J1605_013393 [Eschrichtius robustus]|uniref:Uncharacterized protein n=1 Tax=Eschrichtius robustus TaxID=9764 RepID=A0AB34GIT4_ESCRO|nr:hypothetical protein J1605_013393 [Eschrichtius robustus]